MLYSHQRMHVGTYCGICKLVCLIILRSNSLEIKLVGPIVLNKRVWPTSLLKAQRRTTPEICCTSCNIYYPYGMAFACFKQAQEHRTHNED